MLTGNKPFDHEHGMVQLQLQHQGHKKTILDLQQKDAFFLLILLWFH